MYFARPNNKRSAVSANSVETSDLADKSLDGNFKTLKVNDVSVVTNVTGKLDSSALTTKTLNGNFATLKVMDTNVITDVSGKLDKIGDTMTGPLTITPSGFTQSFAGNGTNPISLGTIATAFSSIPSSGVYNLAIGIYLNTLSNIVDASTAYGNVTIASGAYTNLNIISKGANVTSVTISGSSLILTLVSAVPSPPNGYFITLTPSIGANVTGASVINMGSNVSGKETNAGKIGYQMTTAGTLDIYGAGTTAGSRNIKLWDNVTLPGTLKSNIMSVGTSTNAAITSYLEVGYGEYKQIHAGKIYYNSTLGTVDIVGGGTTTPRSIRLLENVSIAGTLGVTGITTLSGGFNATGGAIQVTKSNQANLGTVSFSYSDLGSPPIGYYVWTIRRTDQTWAAAEDNWAMGRVTINTTSGIVNHWVDTSSNLAVSASSTGFTFMNTTGVTASFVMRLNRLI